MVDIIERRQRLRGKISPWRHERLEQGKSERGREGEKDGAMVRGVMEEETKEEARWMERKRVSDRAGGNDEALGESKHCLYDDCVSRLVLYYL